MICDWPTDVSQRHLKTCLDFASHLPVVFRTRENEIRLSGTELGRSGGGTRLACADSRIELGSPRSPIFFFLLLHSFFIHDALGLHLDFLCARRSTWCSRRWGAGRVKSEGVMAAKIVFVHQASTPTSPPNPTLTPALCVRIPTPFCSVQCKTSRKPKTSPHRSLSLCFCLCLSLCLSRAAMATHALRWFN